MTTDYIKSKDEMFSLFNCKWEAESALIIGYVPVIDWGTEPSFEPDSSKYWARVSKQTVSEDLTGFGSFLRRRYTNEGLLFVQIFCPKAEPQACENGELLSMLARDAYRGKTTDGGIVFRNVRIRELPDEDSYRRFTVIAEYEYDEVT